MRAQKPELVTAPAAGIVSLAEVKEYLRLEADETDEDLVLGSLIKGAASRLDGYSGLLGRALITQSWRQKFDRFPDDGRIPIALGRVQEVSELAYVDDLGASRTFEAWHLVEEPIGPCVMLQDTATWPSTDTRPDAVTLSWTAGYGDAASDVPEQIRIAALQLIGHWYVNREAAMTGAQVFEVPWSLADTIRSMRAFGG